MVTQPMRHPPLDSRVRPHHFSVELQVLLLVGLVVGCLCWRRRTKRRAIQAQEFQAATYFSNSECVFSSCGDDSVQICTPCVDCVQWISHTA